MTVNTKSLARRALATSAQAGVQVCVRVHMHASWLVQPGSRDKANYVTAE